MTILFDLVFSHDFFSILSMKRGGNELIQKKFCAFSAGFLLRDHMLKEAELSCLRTTCCVVNPEADIETSYDIIHEDAQQLG